MVGVRALASVDVCWRGPCAMGPIRLTTRSKEPPFLVPPCFDAFAASLVVQPLGVNIGDQDVVMPPSPQLTTWLAAVAPSFGSSEATYAEWAIAGSKVIARGREGHVTTLTPQSTSAPALEGARSGNGILCVHTVVVHTAMATWHATAALRSRSTTEDVGVFVACSRALPVVQAAVVTGAATPAAAWHAASDLVRFLAAAKSPSRTSPVRRAASQFGIVTRSPSTSLSAAAPATPEKDEYRSAAAIARSTSEPPLVQQPPAGVLSFMSAFARDILRWLARREYAYVLDDLLSHEASPADYSRQDAAAAREAAHDHHRGAVSAPLTSPRDDRHEAARLQHRRLELSLCEAPIGRPDLAPLPWAVEDDADVGGGGSESHIHALALRAECARRATASCVAAAAAAATRGGSASASAGSTGGSWFFGGAAPARLWSGGSSSGKTGVPTAAELAAELRSLSPHLLRSTAITTFSAGVTGYPLVDAAVRCATSRGFIPPQLLPLLVNVWCKVLMLPWPGLVRWLMKACPLVAEAVPLSLSVQWHAGLLAGVDWGVPVDMPDALCGVVGSAAMPLSGYFAARWELAPHPAAGAHPAGHEFGWGPDPHAAFIREWMCPPNAAEPLPPHPSTTTPLLSSAAPARSRGVAAVPHADHSYRGVRQCTCRLGLLPSLPPQALRAPASAASVTASIDEPALDGGGSKSLFRWVSLEEALLLLKVRSVEFEGVQPHTECGLFYTRPAVSLPVARERALACVIRVRDHAEAEATRLGLHRQQLHHNVHGALSHPQIPVLSPPPFHGTAVAAAYLRDRAAAAYDARWGTLDGSPVLVEEDAEVLITAETVRRADGWELVVDDAERKLRMYMQARPGTNVKSVLAMADLIGMASRVVFDAIVNTQRWAQWDLTWSKIEHLCHIDPFNELLLLVADRPPPPFTIAVTQRDFVMTRLVIQEPGRGGVHACALRNAAHLRAPPNAHGTIRGATLGVIGFVVRPLPSSADSCRVVISTAADPRGSLPSALINFVARRTPRVWIDRLKAYVTSSRE